MISKKDTKTDFISTLNGHLKEILKNNQNTGAVIENLECAALILDSNFKIIDINAKGLDILSQEKEHINGKSFYSLLHKSSFLQGIRLFDCVKLKQNCSGHFVVKIKSLKLTLQCDFKNSEHGYYFGFLSKDEKKEIKKQIQVPVLKPENLLHINETFQALIDHSPAAILILDLNSYVLVWNKVAEEVYGWKSKDAIGKLLPTLTEDTFEEHLFIRNDLIEGKSFTDIELERRKRDGSILWLNLSISPIKNKEGEVFATMSIGIDITRRKLAEENLKKTELLYHDVVETAQDLIWRCDNTFCFTFLNPAWEQVLGYTSDEMLGKKFGDFQSEQYANKDKKELSALLKGGTLKSYKTVLLGKNKKEIILLLNAKVMKDENSDVRGLCGTAYDITEQKLAEDALRKNEARLKLAQQIGNIGSLELDLRNGTVNCSPEMLNIFSVSDAAKISGLDVYLKFVFQEDEKTVKKGFEDAILKNIPFDTDHRILLADGKIKHLQIRSRIIRDENDIPIRYVIVVQDITHRKQYEEELEQARKKAEESNKLKTSFLQNMSHEIRTPMNGIMGFSNLLLDPALSDEEKKFYVQTINNSCFNLLNIINDVVEISKIEAGIIQVFKSVFNLNHLIDELFQFFNYESLQKNISLVCYKDLADEKSFINSDEQKIRQVLTNLIKNSLKFTEHGEIEFGYRIKKDEILFNVKDSGIGIDQEFHEIIFERFRQVESSTTRLYGGTGLGLAISKSLIEILNGRIWVESQPGQGSRFFFTIPFEKPDFNLPADSTGTKNSNIPDLSTFTILLAEDDKVNSFFMNEMLTKTNTRIINVENGLEVIDKVKKYPDINLIIMDIKMPLMDGLEATRELRKNNIKIPIIAVTAYAFKEEKRISLEAGCDDYVTKPIMIDEFYKKISNYLLPK